MSTLHRVDKAGKTLKTSFKKLFTFVLILTIIVLVLFSETGFVKAKTLNTEMVLSAVPNPAGVLQTINITMWIWPIPPTSSDRYNNILLRIIAPDGTTQTTQGLVSTSSGLVNSTYIPRTVGTYNFQATYNGGIFASTNNTYSACQSQNRIVIVQQTPNNTRNYIEPTAIVDNVPVTGSSNQTLTFAGHGTDIGGSIINYTWTSSIDGVLNHNSKFTISNLSVGTHRISFQVEDNDNLWSTPDIRTLIINPPTPNVAPTATVDSVAPNPAPFGQSVSFVGHGNDSDGNIVSYNWTSSIDGFLSSSRSFSTSALSVGTHRISFQVEDNDNLWSTPDIRTLIINPPTPNVAPTATVDSVAPNPAPFGQSVSFVGHGNDSDGNIVSYNWTSRH